MLNIFLHFIKWRNRNIIIRYIKNASGILLICYIIFYIVWHLLDYQSQLVEWCAISMPQQIIIGQDIDLIINYNGVNENTFLCVDMHWANRDGDHVGLMSSGRPYPKIKGSGEHAFRMRVKNKKGIHFIVVIIYLSKSGHWEERARVAITDLIPVLSDNSSIRKPELKVIVPHVFSPDISNELSTDRFTYNLESSNKKDSIETVIYIMYILAVILCGWCALHAGHINSSHLCNRYCILWLSLSLILLLLGISEQLRMNFMLTEICRQLFRLLGWYYEREAVQRMIATLVATVGFCLIIFSVSAVKWIGWQIIIAYDSLIVLISLFIINSLSFHYFDDLVGLYLAEFGMLSVLELVSVLCICITAAYYLINEHN
ncbi:MAG: hypothetical protein SVZ03_13350 [Spirochaetota bacterium]|nr:hypothetical protein [Spirochaetota bacterium]